MVRPVAISLFLMGILIVRANAEETQRTPREPDLHSLSRTTFPLEEQATFEAELTLLEDVFAAKLQAPAPAHYTHDRVFGHELRHVLHLIRRWQGEKFRDPLVTHFTGSDDFVIECAEALVSYQDPILRDVLDTRRHYQYRHEGGGIESVQAILLLRGHVAEQVFESCDALLPQAVPESGKRFDWPKGITIPGAVRQLSDRQLSIRVQSWTWLGAHGIIPPTAAIREAWPRLSEGQQEFIANLEPRYLGRQRLRAFYEDVAAISPESIENKLLVRRVEMGDEEAKARARRIVHLRRKHPSVFLIDPGRSALGAICRSPDPVDIPLLIELYRSEEKLIGQLAVSGLCRIDHPDAIDAVHEGLMNPMGLRDVGMLAAIRRQAARDLKHRDRYLAMLADAIRDQNENPNRLEELIDALECMSGREFGSSGLKGGRAQVDLPEARKIADRCLEWYMEYLAAPTKGDCENCSVAPE